MPPKIIPRIFGGIGNQLFIYAAARRLAPVSGKLSRLNGCYAGSPRWHLASSVLTLLINLTVPQQSRQIFYRLGT